MAKLQELRPPFQTGVIDIGAHAVRLDIYEVDRQWKFELLETLSRPLNLGIDVFRNGFVSVDNMDKLIAIASDYLSKLNEYNAVVSRVIATSAIREAFNKELIIDRFRDCGMKLEILEGTNEATLTFLAVRDALSDKPVSEIADSLMLILGTGSLFVIGISGNRMRYCEEIPTGTLRTSDTSGSSIPPLEQLKEQLRSQHIMRRIEENFPASPDKNINLVIIGNSARKLASLAGYAPKNKTDFVEIPQKSLIKTLENCEVNPKKLFRDPAGEDGAEVLAAAVIVKHFFEQLPFKKVLCPGVTTRSAVIADWIRHFRTPDVEPFRHDLATVCSAIGKKYGFDAPHAASVAAASSRLFEKLRHYFSFPEHSALLLEAASYLHDIGRFVDTRQHHRHSWYLVSNTQLPGITASEHRIVAAMARYHGKTMPRETHAEYAALSQEERLAVLKLSAILRVADALDSRRNGELSDFKPVLRARTLKLVTNAVDINSEKYNLKQKGALFEQVFGLELKLENNDL